MDNDVIVIGAGPGGYVAAIEASKLGAAVTLIEKDKIGGTCLNRGCIPTKALVKSAEVIETVKRSAEFGVVTSMCSIDVNSVQERKNQVVDELVLGIAKLLKANKVNVVKGDASFVDSNTLEVIKEDGNKENITGKNIIIATGSSPAVPPIEGADLPGIYTSEDILNFTEVPKSITIVGGGVIGMEIANVLNTMGTKVTVVEFLPMILANQDSDISKRYTMIAKKSGISINTKTKVTKIEKTNTGYMVKAEGPKGELSFESEKILIAVGRKPNMDGLNLDAVRVSYNRKGIQVDCNYETTVKNVYAIGDVNGLVMLAHAASHQGEAVAKHIMGVVEDEASAIPGCVFVSPEIASVGVTEDEAKKQGISYKTSKFMFGANGKALTMGEKQGFIKLIATKHEDFNKNDEIIIGAHIMGAHASDLIHECNIFVSKRMKIGEIKNIVHAHPTLSEVVIEAVNGLVGESVHSI